MERLTCSNTHACHTNLLAGPLELGEQRADLSRASASQWMTKGDGTAFRIYLLLLHSLADDQSMARSEALTAGRPSSLMQKTHWLAKASLIS